MPHNYNENFVAYTGTHDNDTLLGWYRTAPLHEQEFCMRYLENDGENDLTNKVLRVLWGSVAMFTLAPMQDFLGLGSEARMNFPGKPSGNWGWRMQISAMSDSLRLRLKELNYIYYRDRSLEKE